MREADAVASVFAPALGAVRHEHAVWHDFTSIAVHSILGGLASQTVRTTVISELLAPALAYIHGHFADDISLNDLAGMCGIQHFIRLFGCTPHEYLLQYRPRQSKRLLLSSDLTVEQIAEDCGRSAHFAATAGDGYFANGVPGYFVLILPYQTLSVC